jgi:hypothetical protein
MALRSAVFSPTSLAWCFAGIYARNFPKEESIFSERNHVTGRSGGGGILLRVKRRFFPIPIVPLSYDLGVLPGNTGQEEEKRMKNTGEGGGGGKPLVRFALVSVRSLLPPSLTILTPTLYIA